MTTNLRFPKRRSIRLPDYDYSQEGLYFITICTQNRNEIFGQIENGEIILNDLGIIANKCINEISQKYPGVGIDIHQIMPNHIHMIISIVGAGSSRPGYSRPTLGKIVGYLKYQITKHINQITGAKTAPNNTGAKTAPLRDDRLIFEKIFQRNYYEHVIRNEQNLAKIQNYIKTNPQMWFRDRNNF